MRPWKTLSKKTVLDCSKFLQVEMHEVELHDGQVIHEWPWVITPDFINVVAITEEGQFLCFRADEICCGGGYPGTGRGLSGTGGRSAGGGQA